MSRRRAARKIVSPGWMSISRSSMKKVFGLSVSLIVRSCRSPTAQRLGELVGKVFHHADQRVRRGLTQSADRGVAHQLGELVEQAFVPLAVLHQLGRLLGADAARRALAAALVLE